MNLLGSPVALATLVVAIVTFVAVLFTNRNSKKERKKNLMIKKIDEFYAPAVKILSIETESRIRTDTAILELIAEKGYLCLPSILASFPRTELTNYDANEIKELNQDWLNFAKSVWEEMEKNVTTYLRLSGIRKSKIQKLRQPEWHFNLPVVRFR